MLKQFAVEIPTLPVDQCHSHLIQHLKECFAVLVERRAAEKGRQALGTHMVYRETFFANTDASSSAPYPQELNPWSRAGRSPKSTSERSRSIHPQWTKVKGKNKIKI